VEGTASDQRAGISGTSFGYLGASRTVGRSRTGLRSFDASLATRDLRQLAVPGGRFDAHFAPLHRLAAANGRYREDQLSSRIRQRLRQHELVAAPMVAIEERRQGWRWCLIGSSPLLCVLARWPRAHEEGRGGGSDQLEAAQQTRGEGPHHVYLNWPANAS